MKCKAPEQKPEEEPNYNKSPCNQFLVINNNQNFIIEINDYTGDDL
jgi:hypothetical protein